MLLSKLKAEVFKLPLSDRLALATEIIESLHDTLVPLPERAEAIQRMRGLLKTDQPGPTDPEVVALLEEQWIDKQVS